MPWQCSEIVLMMRTAHSTRIYDAKKGGRHHNVTATPGALGPKSESRQPVTIINERPKS